MQYKIFLKNLLKRLHRHRKTGPDIFLFSLPRSGSTLLAEMLNTDPSVKTASEPFSLQADNRRVLTSFLDPNALADRYVDVPPAIFQQLTTYLTALSDGKTWNSYYWSDLLTRHHRLHTRRTLFKTHKLTYYFDDLMHHFREDVAVYLLRHPIPHALSRLDLGWSPVWEQYLDARKVQPLLTDQARATLRGVARQGTELERMVVSWALENLVFLHLYQQGSLPDNVHPVVYEDLVLKPGATLVSLCRSLKLDFHPDMVHRLDKPSSGTVHSARETRAHIRAKNRDQLLNRWRKRVGESETKRIFGLLSTLGIDPLPGWA